MGNRTFNKPDKISWRINHQIRADKLRVISATGELLGVMTVSEALAKAQEAELDLVEIAPKAQPPVAKIVDLGKFRYEEEKKKKKSKKGSKSGEIKEIRFSPFIGSADYASRLKRVNEFLKDGYKIRAVVKFKGRQMDSKKFGYEVLNKLKSDVTTNIVVDMEPKFMGRHLAMVISPTNKKSTEEVKTDSEVSKPVENKNEN